MQIGFIIRMGFKQGDLWSRNGREVVMMVEVGGRSLGFVKYRGLREESTAQSGMLTHLFKPPRHLFSTTASICLS